MTVSVGSVPLNAFFAQFGSRTLKMLPAWSLFLPPEKQFWILAGYLLGDGGFSKAKRGGVLAGTISHTLLSQMAMIAIRCGYVCSLKYATNTNGRPIYFLRFPTPVANEIRARIGSSLMDGKPNDARDVRHNSVWMKREGNFVLGAVKRVERVPYVGTVWNLTVEGANSFVANESVVHNCIMASLIACFCAHDDDFDPMTGRISRPTPHWRSTQKTGSWTAECLCGNKWSTGDPRGDTCDKCRKKGIERHPVSATRTDTGPGRPRTAFMPADTPEFEYSPQKTNSYMSF
jgi:hypothetical protein